jgi:hypothetical protein
VLCVGGGGCRHRDAAVAAAVDTDSTGGGGGWHKATVCTTGVWAQVVAASGRGRGCPRWPWLWLPWRLWSGGGPGLPLVVAVSRLRFGWQAVVAVPRLRIAWPLLCLWRAVLAMVGYSWLGTARGQRALKTAVASPC